MAGQDCSRAVVCNRSHRSYQCAGAEGSAPSSKALYATSARQTRPGPVGQYLDRVPCKSPGRDQISAAPGGLHGASDMGSSPLDEPARSLHPRGAEPCRGLPLPAESSIRGVAPPPGRGQHHLGPLRQGRGNQPPGPGRAFASLARGASLCFSPTSSDTPNTSESGAGGSHRSPGGPLLARQGVVPSPPPTVSWDTVAPPRQERPALSAGGTDLAPQPATPPTVRLAVGRPDPLLGSCTDAVQHTILNARASSTRLQYANRWKLFSSWCGGRGEDPVHCSVPLVLEFLQSLVDKGLSPATLKVYVAAISCNHVKVESCTVGSHRLISSFLKGAHRLNPPRAPRAPVWDLNLVLDTLCRAPFEPLARAELKWLSYKTAFLLAITSAKRVGELHALSVSESCLRWNPDHSGVTLWPNTAFLPKVPSAVNINRPIRLARFTPPSGEAASQLELLCPVRALRAYIKATAHVRRAEQLFVCHDGARKGRALSKQRLSHWVVETIAHAYEASNRPMPPGVKCHSTRGVSTSRAALRGVPLEDICSAASWASASTFTRFYSVNVATPHPLGVVLFPESS